MDRGEIRPPKRRWRRCCLVLGAGAVLLLVLIICCVLREPVRFTFMYRCEQFEGYDCEKLWTLFEEAYVGRDPCQVPMEAYDDFIAAAPIKPACNRMMFWSETKDLVHKFTKKRDCFITLEDTLLGRVVDGLTWCGKEGSTETFTNCPGLTDCENNTVHSYRKRASAAFADAACGNVSAMLNGAITEPFSDDSIFGSIEVPRFNPSKVKSLNIVLVTHENTVSHCADESFKALQEALDDGITYDCKEVAEAQIKECSSDLEKPCEECW